MPVLVAGLGAAVLAAVAGCAAVPISGAAQPLTGSSGQPQQYVQPLPPPGPKPGADAETVVQGFLHASASFAVDPAAARAYLAPGLKWDPAGTVTIVSPHLSFGPSINLPHVAGQLLLQQVVVSGQRIATIGGSGQYSYRFGAVTKFTFRLAVYGSKLLIEQLPAATHLLLTQTDFQEVFQPHALYFYSSLAYPSGALVPDPVYAPVQGPKSALSTDVAGSLVSGLINDRGSWLSGATVTEFPPGTTLLKPVTISNQTALVDLGGKADTATPGQIELMYAQLKQTLTTPAYSSAPVATSVQLSIDGNVQYPAPTSVPVPDAGTIAGSRSQTLYFASSGVVKQLPAGRRAPEPEPVLGQLASPAGITALAATGVGADEIAVAVPAGLGCAVRVGTLGSLQGTRSYPISATGGSCTALNWDNGGNLWAVTPSGIWVLQAGNVHPVQVSAPTLLPAKSRVVALRMAPDAVRAAMLVQIQGHTQLYVAAVRFGVRGVSFGPGVPVGTDLATSGVTAVTWYNPYYLLAVSGSQLFQVPLTGGLSSSLATGPLPAGVNSLTGAAGSLAVGTGAGTVWTASAPYISWTEIRGNATAPAFPG